jgi:hypothetical protein
MGSSTGACRECPKGVICDAVGQELETMQVDAGYYRISSTAWIEDEIRECPVSEACVGGATFIDIHNSYCGEGYEGPLCHVCSTDYFRDSATSKCKECDATNLWPSLAVLAGLILVAVAVCCCCRRNGSSRNDKAGGAAGDAEAASGTPRNRRASSAIQSLISFDGAGMLNHTQVSIRRAEKAREALAVAEMGAGLDEEVAAENGREGREGEEEEENQGRMEEAGRFFEQIKTKLRILVAFSQLVSSIGFNLSINFPSNYTRFLSILSISGLDLFQFLPMDCMMSSDYYDRLLMNTATPLALAAVLVLLHLKFGRSEARQGGTNAFFLVLLNLMYILLPSVSSVILVTFKCDYFEGNDTWYMQADYRLVCVADGERSAERAFWTAYAGGMIFVFPLGIPLVFLILLYRKRYELCPAMKGKGRWWVFTPQPDEGGERREEDEERISHLVFLYEAYSPQYFWFEVV